MKKTKKPTKKIVYEENPWRDDPPGKLVPVEDFLPPPHILKKAKVRITREPEKIALDVKDNDRLEKRAAKVGISPEALMSAVLHDYLTGKLVRSSK